MLARLVELLERIDGLPTVDEDGEPGSLALAPPMPEAEIESLGERLPCPLPEEVEEALRRTAGVDGGAFYEFSLGGYDELLYLEDLFPFAHPIMPDGFGNYWAVDLTASSESWGPILFFCHDPPIIAHQANDVAEFIEQVVEMSNAPHRGPVYAVSDEQSMEIWQHSPHAGPAPIAAKSSDTSLADFAKQLPDDFLVVDMRGGPAGVGFAWGRARDTAEIQRCGELQIFAYPPKGTGSRGLLHRLFGS